MTNENMDRKRLAQAEEAVAKRFSRLMNASCSPYGVVSDPALHAEVRESISGWLGALAGWRVTGQTESPIQGPKGNREFLIAAERV